MERFTHGSKRSVNEIRAMPRWESVRVQIDSGAIDTVGPKEIAKAFGMKETVLSKRGIGHVAARGSSIENYGEKRIAGRTDGGE